MELLNKNKKKILIVFIVAVCSCIAVGMLSASLELYAEEPNMHYFMALIKALFVMLNLGEFTYLAMK